MENIVLVVTEKKEMEYPEHWLRASECRELANNWENEEIKNCMNSVMERIKEAASMGESCYVGHIKSTRPPHFYEVLEKIFIDLGYTVTVPKNPSDPDVYSKIWGFSWKK